MVELDDRLFGEAQEFAGERDPQRLTQLVYAQFIQIQRMQPDDVLSLVHKIQQQSVRNGTDTLTLEDINAEIAASRAERRQKRAVPA
jgi:hypothetical protein